MLAQTASSKYINMSPAPKTDRLFSHRVPPDTCTPHCVVRCSLATNFSVDDADNSSVLRRATLLAAVSGQLRCCSRERNAGDRTEAWVASHSSHPRAIPRPLPPSHWLLWATVERVVSVDGTEHQPRRSGSPAVSRNGAGGS